MYDADKAGLKSAERIGKIIAPLVKKLEILTLQGVKDPGEMPQEEVQLLKHALRFNM
jgi:DNA primase